jgi:hypothetical protein
MSVERITVVLDSLEAQALQRLASAELRKPQQQARYLLRQALGLTSEDDQSQPMHNRAGDVLADSSAVAS